jgi:putative intracellular protease/amidase
MAKKILHIVTNVAHYDNKDHPTGLWLSELAHAWHIFEQHGFEQMIVSPLGGHVPLEPRSLKFPNYDKITKNWYTDADRMTLLENTLKPSDITSSDYDAIYFTGGHAVMYDFLDDENLQEITRDMFENGKVVSSVCHGCCGLLNVKLSEGNYLIDGRRITGFSWTEEVLARVNKLVPYNAEETAKERGALYTKAAFPFAPYVVADGNLVTGQNPGSAAATAKRVAQLLSQK